MSISLALLSGALLAASFPKFGYPVFAWIATAPLIVAVVLATVRSPRSPARAFGLGVASGLVYFSGTLYWVVEVMHSYGGLSAWVATLVALLLAAYLALYSGMVALLIRQAVLRFGVSGIWLTPLFWVAGEWLRSWVGGGFPWVLLGASQATVLPIVQVTSIVGVYGLSALIATVGTASAALALAPGRRHTVAACVVAGVLASVAAWGAWRVQSAALLTSGTPLRVGLLQGNIQQAEKYDRNFRDRIMTSYLDMTREVLGAGAGLVIWPEASTPFFLDMDAVAAEPIRRLAAQASTPFIIGTDEYAAPGSGMPERFYNSAVLIGSDGRSRQTYRKMHLVPFGEYVPLKRLLFFVGPLIQAVSDFSPGTDPVVFDVDGRRVSVAVCYEVVYPEVGRQFVAAGSQLLATITNDAWFGRSAAAYQHFDQAVLRAVEEGRYLVRSANTGISGAVDPYGRVLARTDLFVPAAVTVDVRLLDGRTIYSRVGDVVAWMGLLVTAGVVVTARRRRR